MDKGFDWDGGELWFWDKGLCSVGLSALPSPTPPHYPPAHPSILFQPFGQLSLNPANHKLVWSVGNQTRLWPPPQHTDSGGLSSKELQDACEQARLHQLMKLSQGVRLLLVGGSA